MKLVRFSSEDLDLSSWWSLAVKIVVYGCINLVADTAMCSLLGPKFESSCGILKGTC